MLLIAIACEQHLVTAVDQRVLWMDSFNLLAHCTPYSRPGFNESGIVMNTEVQIEGVSINKSIEIPAVGYIDLQLTDILYGN